MKPGNIQLSEFMNNAKKVVSLHLEKSFTVIIFDIDKLGSINNIYGYEEGDRLLDYINTILRNLISSPNIYERIYSDNYAVLFEYSSITDIKNIVQQIKEELKKQPKYKNIKLSFGVSRIDHKNTQLQIACFQASNAKAIAKNQHDKEYILYEDSLLQLHNKEMISECEMIYALEEKEYELYLQPKISIPNTEVVGAEALVRWIHPVKGVMLPIDFIPVLDKDGYMIQLDYYIWEKAFAIIRSWMDKGYKPIPISVNVSKTHMRDKLMLENLLYLSRKYDVPKRLIELEINQTILNENKEILSEFINSLRKEGFLISIDGISTESSSWNILKEVSVDVIKLDKSFVNKEERSKSLIQYVSQLAKQLNIDVIAQGVENFMQILYLYETGCEKAQGSFYSMPLSVDRFENYAYDIN